MTKGPTLFLILIFYPASLINASQTSAQKGHAKGQRFAADQRRTLATNPDNIVPHYAGTNTPETQLDPYSLNQKAQGALSDPESAGHFVMTSEGNRQHFDIDPQTDSLLKASKDAISNPESYLNVTEEVYDEPTDVVEVKCTKPLEYLLTIERIYTPHVKTTTKKVLKTFSADNWEDHGFYNRVCNPDKTKLIDLAGIGFVFGRKRHKGPVTNLSSHTKNWLFTRWRARLYPNRHKSHQWATIHPKTRFNILSANDIHSITQVKPLSYYGLCDYDACWCGYRFTLKAYQTKTIKKAQERWTNVSTGVEALLESGDFSYLGEEILEGPDTRTIKGLQVSNDKWRVLHTYASQGPGIDTCQPLLDKGCVQVSSTCLEEVQGQCIRVENTFHCPDKVRHLRRSLLKGGNVFCLDGTCTDVSWEDNQDMLEALSKLALFQEMEKSWKDLHVFHGRDLRCSRHCWGFSDCCQISGGWGHSLGFTKCSKSEKDLAGLRGEKKCHYVGSYCAEHLNLGFTKICLRKKQTYCCFGSILMKLIHQQGRSQIGLGWGSGEHPVCRGLTPEEVARIDFDQLNLEEAFAELLNSLNVPETTEVIDRFQKNWQKRLPSIQERVLDQQTQGGDPWDLNLAPGESL
jgi:hypothetical protein